MLYHYRGLWKIAAAIFCHFMDKKINGDQNIQIEYYNFRSCNFLKFKDKGKMTSSRNSITMKYCSATEMPWPINLVCQIKENLFVCDRPLPMSHHGD